MAASGRSDGPVASTAATAAIPNPSDTRAGLIMAAEPASTPGFDAATAAATPELCFASTRLIIVVRPRSTRSAPAVS